MLEDIEKSETTRDELYKKVVDLKIEILRNESHIENQNKSIETIHEDVKSAIDKLSIEEIQKNNSRLASKVKYIEEVFEKFNEKELLSENIITEPSSSGNSDPLTPLDQKFVTALPSMLLGTLTTFTFGLLWLHQFTGQSWGWTIKAGLTPFIIGETLKIIIAGTSLPLLWRAVNRKRN